ncbi:MAG: hypothetical protein MMC33_004407 [Icmadophila ericetorum]|nr:hypothetical protein [Icmadophila ericetorum]
MPKVNAPTSLLAMMDSEVENSMDQTDFEMLPQIESNQENVPTQKTAKAKSKAAISKARKTKPASKRLSGGRTAIKKRTTTKREPLKEQLNEGRDDLTEDGGEEPAQEIQKVADESEVPIPEKQPVKRGRKAKAPAKQTLETSKEVQADDETESTFVQAKSRKHGGRVAPETQTVIPETQPEPMEIDRPVSPEMDMEDEDAIPQSAYRQSNRIQPASKQRPVAIVRKRAGSASDTEKASNDAGLRRKLGSMAEKLESLELRYKNLREIGVKEAEANYRKLKDQSDESAKAANTLINSLKGQLANQKALAQESHTLRQQLAAKETELVECTSKANRLASSLSESQMESKALQAKIAAMRNTSVENIQSKTPGSALKNGKTPARTLMMMGSAEVAHTMQVAQLKEELYSDLTGLIIRGVDQSVEGTSYDCLQTGRNGSTFPLTQPPLYFFYPLACFLSIYLPRLALHFILAIPALGTQTPGISYEDSAIQYSPRLDANRDRELLQLLPDYMTEEITFTRENAGGFYKKLFDKLTTKAVKE